MNEERPAPAATPAPLDLGPGAQRDRGRAIFINYRREDSGGQARALLYALERSFPEQVFMDVKGLAPGVNYLAEIERTIGSCRAVIVLVGKGWAQARDASGRRRLDDPRDVVTLEVAAALRRKDVLVIPVLVAGATLPAESELPESLRGLLDRQCLHLTDQDWDYNVAQLVRTLRQMVGTRRAAVLRSLRYAVPLVVALLAVIAGVSVMSRPSRIDAPGAPAATAPPQPAQASPAPARAAPEPSQAAPPAAPSAPPSLGAAPVPAVKPASGPRKAAATELPPAAPARPRAEAPARRPDPPAVAKVQEPGPPRRADDVAVRASPPPAAPEAATSWVTREIVTYQQFFGSPELKERGQKLFEAARWRLEPRGTLTFEPREKPGAFFPITVPVTRDGARVSFAGSRVARASDGLAYVHLAGRFVSMGASPELNVELEIGRASGADGADHDPTYRARARLRLGPP